MNKFTILIACLLGSLFNPLVNGDIVSTSWSGTVYSELNSVIDSTGSTVNSDTVQATVKDDFGYTQSTMRWEWDGCNLRSRSVLSEEMTEESKTTNKHLARSELFFQFTIDDSMDFNTSGSWGFSNVTAGGENLSITLSDGVNTIFGDTTSSTGGTSSDSWSGSGTLTAGTYFLIVSSNLEEVFEKPSGVAQAAWNMDSFKLTHASVPEPGAILILFSGLSGVLISRRRRKFPIL